VILERTKFIESKLIPSSGKSRKRERAAASHRFTGGQGARKSE